MKYSFNWLKDYLKTDKSPEELGQIIAALGSDVEDIRDDSGDVALEAEITPNRGDLLSHFGMARDIGAYLKKKVEKPELEINEGKRVQGEISVETKSDKCPLYLARVIKGVKVKESPDWLKERLIACGAKPINNIVDVTNYAMLDVGHPLHAFDKSKLSGNKIIVKEIENDMDVVTLDGEARVLLPQMLGIWDDKQPIAIAGVMGLLNSEVDEKTTDVVLEAAVFDRKSVRKTAKLLNFKTEASARFERGVDAEGVQYAIDKAAKLIQEIAGGFAGGTQIFPTIMAENKSVIPDLIRNLKIEYDKINSYADLNLENNQIDKILENLGFEIGDGQATIPTWRHDIAIWQDLAEEVYRINGIDKIKPIPLSPTLPKTLQHKNISPGVILESEAKRSATCGELVESIGDLDSDITFHKKEKIKDYLVELGLDETVNYTFLSEEDSAAAKLDSSDLLEVANPVQEENRYLRNSLIPGLLKAVAKNPSFDDIEIFELGSAFSGQEEWMNLAIVTSGKSARPVEKLVESLCGRFNFDKDAFKIYEIPQEELKRFKIKKPSVQAAEAKIRDLLKNGKFNDLGLLVNENKSQYRPISKFPAVKRDLAFVIDKNISSIEIRASILEIAPKVILAEIFDEFESDKLGQGKKSVAFHIWLEDQKKTLLDKDADEIILKIVDELREKYKAELRS